MFAKIIKWLLGIIIGFFTVTFTLYFFNLDMKAAAMIEPLLRKHYDNMQRKQYI